ncbi:MAG TPA: putative Ig domain-containing protein [Chloroflexia bacterium]|nr:putative Ig domain-containing protein [Chloroflexia bacterium]
MKKLGISILVTLVTTLALGVGLSPAANVAAAEPLVITTTSLGDGNVGTSYVNFITSSGGQGTPHRFKVISGKLPDGLRMADSYGMQSTVITGTPTRVQTTTFTVRVQDQTGHTATRTFTITINPTRPLVITNDSSTLWPGTVGSSYATSFTADGGTQPYRWSIVAGQLPPGLRLSGNVVSGTPTAAGTFTFTARVTDNGGQQASQQFTITIN